MVGVVGIGEIELALHDKAVDGTFRGSERREVHLAVNRQTERYRGTSTSESKNREDYLVVIRQTERYSEVNVYVPAGHRPVQDLVVKPDRIPYRP